MRKYLARKMDDCLVAWKQQQDRKPVLLKGARQIGKTEAIRHFAKSHYAQFHEINFSLRGEFRQIVEDGCSVEAILRKLSLIEPNWRFVEGKTLLLFDEVQDCPEVATSLKSFAQDGRFDVIASGSMLGVQYKRISSLAMGYKTDMDMSSMDFEEFLRAKGYGDEFVEELYGHVRQAMPFSALQMKIVGGLFRDYCILGGMPEVVESYIVKGTFEGVLKKQRELVDGYRDDIKKYADGMDKARIRNVYDHIPAQLARENKKFQVSRVAKGARFRDYRGCVEWLEDAGVVMPCYCLNFPELPLKGNYEEDKFKLYITDTGLLVSMLDDAAQDDLRRNQNFGVYKGALYENIVAEALRKSGLDLFYWKKDNATLEQDFFVRTAKSLVPVEVKSERGVGRSMRTLISSAHYQDVFWGLKLHAGNVGCENRVLTLPYWCTFLVSRLLSDEEAICNLKLEKPIPKDISS